MRLLVAEPRLLHAHGFHSARQSMAVRCADCWRSFQLANNGSILFHVGLLAERLYTTFYALRWPPKRPIFGFVVGGIIMSLQLPACALKSSFQVGAPVVFAIQRCLTIGGLQESCFSLLDSQIVAADILVRIYMMIIFDIAIRSVGATSRATVLCIAERPLPILMKKNVTQISASLTGACSRMHANKFVNRNSKQQAGCRSAKFVSCSKRGYSLQTAFSMRENVISLDLVYPYALGHSLGFCSVMMLATAYELRFASTRNSERSQLVAELINLIRMLHILVLAVVLRTYYQACERRRHKRGLSIAPCDETEAHFAHLRRLMA